jgi:preprotein translocase subunit SecE
MLAVADYFEDSYIMENEFLDNMKDKAIQKYKINLANIKKQLVDAGVEINLIEKIVKPHALAAAKELKQGNVKNIGNHFQQILDEMKKTSIINQLAKSILILLLVLIIGQFILTILVTLGAPAEIAFLILAIFVAPLTEEAGKYFSIKQKSTGLYFIVFNLFEFTGYVGVLLGMGMTLPVVIFSRLLAVLMHYATTSIQWGAAKQNKSGQGYLTAVLVHGLWNFFASLNGILQAF